MHQTHMLYKKHGVPSGKYFQIPKGNPNSTNPKGPCGILIVVVQDIW